VKILVFAAFYHPYRGGYVESLHGLLRRLAAAGQEIIVLTCNTHQRPSKEIIDGIEVLRTSCWNPAWLAKSYPIPKPSVLGGLRRLGKKEFDLVSTQTRFYPTTWLGFLFAKWHGLPIIHTERGAFHPVTGNQLVNYVGKVIDRSLGWAICRFSDKVVGVSQAACRFARHLGARKSLLIYNGVDVDFWAKDGQGESKENGLTIAFVGRLVHGKGVQDLLLALVLLRSRLPAVQFKSLKLAVVGDGPHKSYLMNLCDELRIKESVVFFGEMGREGVKTVLQQADIFVNPSYSEGLPRSVLEAAAVGLPVVATNVGGTVDILGGGAGILVPPGSVEQLSSELLTLISNKEIRRRLSLTAARNLRSRFDWNLITKQYLALINQVSNL